MSGRLCIVEPDPAGHHLKYVQLVADRAPSEVEVHLAADAATPDGVRRGPDVEATNASIKPAVAVALTDPTVTRVLVPDADRWLPALVLAQLRARRRGRLRVLITRPYRQQRTVAATARFILKVFLARLLEALAGRGTVAFLAVPGMRWDRWWPRTAGAVYDENLVPVVDQSSDQARAALGINQEALVLGMVGVMSARKHPRLAAQAAGLLTSGEEAVVLLCVGPQQDDSAQGLDAKAAPASVVTVARFVSDEELSTAITASDVLVCLYDNEGSSGIVTTAVSHARPVVAAGARGVKAMVSSLGAGVVCDLEAEAIAEAVERARATRPKPIPMPHPVIGDWAIEGLGRPAS